MSLLSPFALADGTNARALLDALLQDRDGEVVPFAQGNRLHDAAGEPKTLFKVERERHGDALTRDNGAYRRKTHDWLPKALAK